VSGIETVAKILGHEDRRVTSLCYAELLDERVRLEVLSALSR